MLLGNAPSTGFSTGAAGGRPRLDLWHLIKKFSLMSTVVEQPSSLSKGALQGRRTHGQHHHQEHTGHCRQESQAQLQADGTALGPFGGTGRAGTALLGPLLSPPQDAARSSGLITRHQREELDPNQPTVLLSAWVWGLDVTCAATGHQGFWEWEHHGGGCSPVVVTADGGRRAKQQTGPRKESGPGRGTRAHSDP